MYQKLQPLGMPVTPVVSPPPAVSCYIPELSLVKAF